jgi:multidrug transporter EmrE-like cation transporter
LSSGGAALSKTLNLTNFSKFLASVFPGLPIRMDYVAIAAIAVEFALAAGLIVPKSRRASLFGCLGLSLILAGIYYLRLTEGISVPCTCFGAMFTLPGGVMLVVNALTALISIRLILE